MTELVPAELGCPTCTEVDMDHLLFIDEEEVYCESCGEKYNVMEIAEGILHFLDQ